MHVIATTPSGEAVLPQHMQRGGAELLHQQCWAWGRDIRHQPNLLVAHGMQRVPNPAAGPTRYELCGHGGYVALWGFGLVYGSGDSAVLLQRYAFEPRVVRRTNVELAWAPDELLPAAPCSEPERANAMTQVLAAVRWISEYEEWVLAVVGADHREATVASWANATMSASDARSRWRELGDELELLIESGGTI